MRTHNWLVPSALALVLSVGVSSRNYAQDAAAPQANQDSMMLFTGDWDWTANLRDSTVSGAWRVNYANGRFTGVVTRPGMAPQPIKSFTVRGRTFTLTADWNGDMYTFQGTLENPRNASGTFTTRGSLGRLRIQKRGS